MRSKLAEKPPLITSEVFIWRGNRLHGPVSWVKAHSSCAGRPSDAKVELITLQSRVTARWHSFTPLASLYQASHARNQLLKQSLELICLQPVRRFVNFQLTPLPQKSFAQQHRPFSFFRCCSCIKLHNQPLCLITCASHHIIMPPPAVLLPSARRGGNVSF